MHSSLPTKQPISPADNPVSRPAISQAYNPARRWASTGQNWRQGLKQLADNDTWWNRISTHLIVLALVALAISLSDLQLPAGKAIRPFKPTPPELVATTAEESADLLILPTQLRDYRSEATVFQMPVPRTIIPARTRLEITRYTVEVGDTVTGIAAKFSLAPETIIWSNADLADNPHRLQVGQEVIILPMDGIYHQVGGTDTVDSIAAAYQVEAEAIVNCPLNELDPDDPTLVPGQWLVVPGGTRAFTPRQVAVFVAPPEGAMAGSGLFQWPTSGYISQDYWGAHPAIDIANDIGVPVLAADDGYVVAAGWDDTGYGYIVALDHGNGFQTLYAHLDIYQVEVGTNVSKGQQIGTMGRTGNATGPHLHFEIRQGTLQHNPLGFLP